MNSQGMLAFHQNNHIKTKQKTFEGEAVEIERSVNDYVGGTINGVTEQTADYVNADGVTTQTGTPTPDAPVPMISNILAGTYKITLPNGDIYEFTLTDDMRGIDTVQDRIVFELRSLTGWRDTKCGKYDIRGNENGFYLAPTHCISVSVKKGNSGYTKFLANNYRFKDVWSAPKNENYCAYNYGNNNLSENVWLTDSRYTSFASFMTYIAGLYILGTPISVTYIRPSTLRTAIIFTKVTTSAAPEFPASALTVDLSPDYPRWFYNASGNIKSRNSDNTQSTTIILPDTPAVGEVKDSYTYIGSGIWEKTQRIGKINSYAGETITTAYISSTGALTTGATIYYVLASPIITQVNLGELKTFPRFTAIEQDGTVKAYLQLTAKTIGNI